MSNNHESGEYPSGIVTFLFTDIQDSTGLWERHPEAMAAALAHHDQLIADTVRSNDGIVVKMTGDGVHAVFRFAAAAVSAILEFQQQMLRITSEPIGSLRVRAALLSGEAELRGGDYYGPVVNRAARLMSCASGGQILLSASTTEIIKDHLPSGAGFLDLGEHRLRSLDRPEHVYQLFHPDLPSEFPPLKTSVEVPNNLPSLLTSFIGREKETRELIHQLESNVTQVEGSVPVSDPRLFTLTGPGGTGKTRLSIHVAGELLDEYPDGVWLVELAPVTDPNRVIQSVAAPMGLQEHPARPILDVLVDYLRPKRVLIILDNCEHLIDECANLADHLLRLCPKMKLLASSREALGINGERVIRLRSMALPPSHDGLSTRELGEYEAIRLFLARAGSVKSDFALTQENAVDILQICRRLDGIPLAIELAATRVRVLSPSQIAKRLDDRFKLLTGGSRTALPRQRTLQALIDWSYDLLSEPECVLLRRLSVFSGGWTLDAAEWVTGTEPLDPYEVLDLLEQLVKKSLVQTDEIDGRNRYRMLETIRQYAQEKLAESEEAAALRDRHLAYFVDQNAQAWQSMLALQPSDLDRGLSTDSDNIRAARAWALEHDLEAALSLAAYRSNRLNQSLPAAETLRYVDHVLQLAESRADFSGREAPRRLLSLYGSALGSACILAFGLGRNPLSLNYGSKAIDLGRSIDERMVLGWALGVTSAVHYARGEFEISGKLRDESNMLARETGNRWIQAMTLVSIRPTQAMLEDSEAMWLEWEQGMALFREGGEKWGQALGYHVASFVHLALGDVNKAKQYAELARELWTSIGDRQFAGAPNATLADISRMTGELDEAERLFVQAIPAWRDFGNFGAIARCLECLAFIVRARRTPAEQETMKHEDQMTQLRKAVTFLGAAEAIREEHDTPMTAAERPEWEQENQSLRDLIGEGAFEAAWQEGYGLSIDQVINTVVVE